MLNANDKLMVITGTRKGIGKYLAEYYHEKGWYVIGCSRGEADFQLPRYRHFCLDAADEKAVKSMFAVIRKEYGKVDALINNAGIASMNHILLTPLKTVNNIFSTNFIGTFLFCREASKIMKKNKFGRIVNFATVATPLNLEGEAVYAASKAAIESFTKILARETSDYGITVNALGPTPIETDLIRSVPKEKMDALISRQAVKRLGEFRDVSNCIDFFIKPESDFITAQIVFLGGVS